MQSAIAEIVTKDRKTLLQFKQTRARFNLLLPITLPSKTLTASLGITAQSLQLKQMADLFKYPPMAAFKRPRKLKDMIMRARLDDLLPNDGLKTCSDAMPNAFCASTAQTRTFFLKAPS